VHFLLITSISLRYAPLAEGDRSELSGKLIAKKYYDTSRPAYCARHGFVDEILELKALRGYLKAFAGAVHQNPQSTCPRHQMLLPRIIKG